MCLSSCFKEYPILKKLHIYIDCNNVVYSRFNQNQCPLLSDIILLIHYLTRELGFSEENIHCICDPSLRYHIDKQVEFEVLVKEGKIIEAPKIADEIILSFALKHKFCFIVSNDKFRDYFEQLPSEKWLEDRRISFMFISNQVCLSPNIDYKEIDLVLLNTDKNIQNENIQSNRKEKSYNHKKTTLEILDLIESSEGSFNLF